MNKLIVLFICSALCMTVRSDAVDDMRADYTNQLTAIANTAEQKINLTRSTLETAELYFTTSSATFTQQGLDNIKEVLTSFNKTAADLILAAILDNRPATVLTCITTQHDRAYGIVEARVTPFEEAIAKAAAANNFASVRSSLDLISSQLVPLLEVNINNINTCVVLDCFENNLNDARTEYDNLTKNVEGFSTTLNNDRDKFNTAVINALSSLKKNTASDQSSGEKNMNNCT